MENDAVADTVIEMSGVVISPDGMKISIPSRDHGYTEFSYQEVEQRIVLLQDIAEKARKIRITQAALESELTH